MKNIILMSLWAKTSLKFLRLLNYLSIQTYNFNILWFIVFKLESKYKIHLILLIIPKCMRRIIFHKYILSTMHLHIFMSYHVFEEIDILIFVIVYQISNQSLPMFL